MLAPFCQNYLSLKLFCEINQKTVIANAIYKNKVRYLVLLFIVTTKLNIQSK